jgi:hypothetical protein
MKTDLIQQFILKDEHNLRIAASVIEVWPEVRQRIVDGFLERLEAQLKMKLEAWEFSRSERFFEDRAASYDFTKPAWAGEYNLGLQASEYGSRMVIGVWRDKDKIVNRPFSNELLDAIQINHPNARFIKPWWDAAILMKSPASDWQKPDVLWQMNKNISFLDDVAEQLLDLAKTSEPIIDGLVRKYKK